MFYCSIYHFSISNFYITLELKMLKMNNQSRIATIREGDDFDEQEDRTTRYNRAVAVN
jgi:hypothetical protein